MVKSPPDLVIIDRACCGLGNRSPRRQLAAVRSFVPKRRENSASPIAAINSESEEMESITAMISRSVDFYKPTIHKTSIAAIHTQSHHGRMDTKTESGLRIKACRTAAKLKQREVCEQIPGLTVTRLSNWEKGLRMLSIDEAKRLAPVLKTTAGYLLTIDNDPGDQRLQTLIATYKLLDERGKTALQRVAETECEYVVGNHQDQKTAA